MEKKKSFLAHLLSTELDEKREELMAIPLNEILRHNLEEIGLYVFESTLEGNEEFMHFGNIVVATDGMPERARRAVEEVLRSQSIEEYTWPDWRDLGSEGKIRVAWEVWYEQKAK